MSANDPTSDRTLYWRLDHQGWPLSRSFRSACVNDEDEMEEATSCCGSLTDLLRHGAFAVGDVAIVAFRGRCVATGMDNEPVVVPEAEVARYHHADWDGLGRDADGYPVEADDIESEADLLALGWERVQALAVQD